MSELLETCLRCRVRVEILASDLVNALTIFSIHLDYKTLHEMPAGKPVNRLSAKKQHQK